jgi:hypothetical protein
VLAAAHNILATATVIIVVVAVLAFVAYALTRPFTHIHHEHGSNRLWDHGNADSIWKPLD